MTDDQSKALDYFLELWHRHSLADRGVRGWNDRAPVVGECRGYGLQYESQVEAQDIRADNLTAKQIDHEVRQMPDPHRAAIAMEARNLHTGKAVWSSPRLPEDRAKREMIVFEARAMLAKRLQSAGVM